MCNIFQSTEIVEFTTFSEVTKTFTSGAINSGLNDRVNKIHEVSSILKAVLFRLSFVCRDEG